MKVFDLLICLVFEITWQINIYQTISIRCDLLQIGIKLLCGFLFLIIVETYSPDGTECIYCPNGAVGSYVAQTSVDQCDDNIALWINAQVILNRPLWINVQVRYLTNLS